MVPRAHFSLLPFAILASIGTHARASPGPATASVDCERRPRPRNSDGTAITVRMSRTADVTEATVRISEVPVRIVRITVRISEVTVRIVRITVRISEVTVRIVRITIRIAEDSERARLSAAAPRRGRRAVAAREPSAAGVGYSQRTRTVLRGYSSGTPWACLRRTRGVLDGVLTVLTAGGGGARATAGRRRAGVGGGGEAPDLQERIRLCGIIHRCNHDATATTTMQPMQTRRCSSVASDATAACPVSFTVASSPSLSFTLRRPVITQRYPHLQYSTVPHLQYPPTVQYFAVPHLQYSTVPPTYGTLQYPAYGTLQYPTYSTLQYPNIKYSPVPHLRYSTVP
jgi:hypothetical protein